MILSSMNAGKVFMRAGRGLIGTGRLTDYSRGSNVFKKSTLQLSELLVGGCVFFMCLALLDGLEKHSEGGSAMDD